MVLPILCLLVVCLIGLRLFPSVLTHLILLATLAFHNVQFLGPCSFPSIPHPSATFSLIHAFLTTYMLTIPSSIYLFPVPMLQIIFQFYLLLSTLSTLGLPAIVSQSILPKLNICSYIWQFSTTCKAYFNIQTQTKLFPPKNFQIKYLLPILT